MRRWGYCKWNSTKFHVINLYWSAVDGLRSPAAWGKKPLFSLVTWRRRVVYRSPDTSRVNRLCTSWVFSFSIICLLETNSHKRSEIAQQSSTVHTQVKVSLYLSLARHWIRLRHAHWLYSSSLERMPTYPKGRTHIKQNQNESKAAKSRLIQKVEAPLRENKLNSFWLNLWMFEWRIKE